MASELLFFSVKENDDGGSWRQRSSCDVSLELFPSEKSDGRDASTSLPNPARGDAHQTGIGQCCI